MAFTKSMGERAVRKAGGLKMGIIQEVQKMGYWVDDDTDRAHPKMFNLKVWNDDGSMVRIYKTYRGTVEVQKWKPVDMKYSGIPTFEPSGKKSL